jgi:hypothetical protein
MYLAFEGLITLSAVTVAVLPLSRHEPLLS